MGVAGAGDVLGRGTELHGDRRLRDHVASIGADDVHAQDAIGRSIGQDLDEPFTLQVDPGARIGGKGKPANGIGDAAR